jgi:hypothetical protein
MLISKVANYLKTATGLVSIFSATAPTSGQILTATGPNSATWQTPAAGGGGWTLVDYDTQAATTIDFTGLDLDTHLVYKVFLTFGSGTASAITATINNITSNTYSSIGRNSEVVSGAVNSSAGFSNANQASMGVGPDGKSVMIEMTIWGGTGGGGRTLFQVQSTSHEFAATSTALKNQNISFMQAGETNVTSLKFTAANSGTFHVWIFRPNTS